MLNPSVELQLADHKNTSILFLENRSITDLWSGVAAHIKQDFKCSLLRFNAAFGSTFPGPIIDLLKPEPNQFTSNQDIDALVNLLCATDRALYLHKATPNAVRAGVTSVLATLASLKFDVVIGEVTSVYERTVEFYCRRNGIPFLAPMTARIPPDRFFFLDGAAMHPLPIPSTSSQGMTGIEAMQEAHGNAGRNDLSVKLKRGVRIKNTLRTFLGWVYGERLHTPSPWHKFHLQRRQKKSIQQFADLHTADIHAVDRSAIVYCMHVQPESTLDTYCPDLWDQTVVIRSLAEACLAAGRPFFVRTHPRARHEIDLHLPALLSAHVKLLSVDIPMQKLLDVQPTIVTVLGTVLLEAATRGAPTVALGDSYLARFPGVLRLAPKDFPDYLAGTFPTTTGSPEAQRIWFESMRAITHQGLISPPEWSDEALSARNLADIAAAIRIAIRWLGTPRPEAASK